MTQPIPAVMTRQLWEALLEEYPPLAEPAVITSITAETERGEAFATVTFEGKVQLPADMVHRAIRLAQKRTNEQARAESAAREQAAKEHAERAQWCHAEDWYLDGANRMIVAGICTRPLGHETSVHQEWRRDNTLASAHTDAAAKYVEWIGQAESRAPEPIAD